MKAVSLYALIVVLSLATGTVLAAEQSMSQCWSKPYSFQQVLGTPIKNQQGEDLGRIRDIVFDLQGRVPFAVISEGGLWGVGGKLVTVPFNALSFDSDEYFTLNTTKEKLASAPIFRPNDLSNEKWAENVYRYFGLQPYWTEGRQKEEGGRAIQENSMGGSTEGERF